MGFHWGESGLSVLGKGLVAFAFLFLLGCLEPVHEGTLADIVLLEDVDEETVDKLSRSESFTYFRQQVNPMLNSKCSSCHGKDQAPLFYSAKSELTYLNSLQLISFIRPTNSRVLMKSADLHCGEVAQCGFVDQEFVDRISEWAKLEIEEAEEVPEVSPITEEIVPGALLKSEPVDIWLSWNQVEDKSKVVFRFSSDPFLIVEAVVDMGPFGSLFVEDLKVIASRPLEYGESLPKFRVETSGDRSFDSQGLVFNSELHELENENTLVSGQIYQVDGYAQLEFATVGLIEIWLEIEL